MFSFLRRWFGSGQRSDLYILMYTRQGCHLCEEAWEVLLAHQKLRGFKLEKIDVDTDQTLVSQYGNCVPVVVVNGTVRFRGRVNEVLLRRMLDTKG
jgi:hypothetical protein